jgi:hypothetical protein
MAEEERRFRPDCVVAMLTKKELQFSERSSMSQEAGSRNEGEAEEQNEGWKSSRDCSERIERVRQGEQYPSMDIETISHVGTINIHGVCHGDTLIARVDSGIR